MLKVTVKKVENQKGEEELQTTHRLTTCPVFSPIECCEKFQTDHVKLCEEIPKNIIEVWILTAIIIVPENTADANCTN
jgi:hypothetical protein